MEKNYRRLYSKLNQFSSLGFTINLVNGDTVLVWQDSQDGFPPFVEVSKGMITIRNWLCGTNDTGNHESNIERIIGICEGFIL